MMSLSYEMMDNSKRIKTAEDIRAHGGQVMTGANKRMKRK